MTDLPTFELERVFSAPPALVWRTWTDPALLPRWYGPGVVSIVHKIDPVVGGEWLHEMQYGGGSNFQRAEYLEVDPPNRLVWLHYVTDADWAPAPNPMMPDWPRAMRTAVRFQAVEAGTKMHMTWAPHDATEAEIACFAAAMEGAGSGWGKGMDAMEALLAELQAGAD